MSLAGSGIVATTDINHFAATAPVGCLNNKGTEHGPLRLHVPHLTQYIIVAHPEVEVEAPNDRRLPRNLISWEYVGIYCSVRHSPTSSEPTQHQVLIG